MRLSGTEIVIMRAVQATGVSEPDALALETGIPAYIIRRYPDAIERGTRRRRKAELLQQAYERLDARADPTSTGVES